MTEVLRPETVELIKHVADQYFRQVQERTQVHVKDQVNRAIFEQMNLCIEHLLRSQGDLGARLYEVMRDAQTRSGPEGRASVDRSVEANMEAFMRGQMEQMKLHFDGLAELIKREALEGSQALFNQQLAATSEALKQHFEQRYQHCLETMRSEIGRSEASLSQTVDARLQTLGAQLREEFRVANALMRQYVSEQFTQFWRQLQSEFQALTRLLEDRFVSLRNDLREVFQHELISMRRALQEEFGVLRQELKADIAVMKNELKTELKEFLREEMRQHAQATRASLEDVVQRIQLQMAR
jgi:hypothetical protein